MGCGGCCFEYFLHDILGYINLYLFLYVYDIFKLFLLTCIVLLSLLLLLTVFIVIRFIHEPPARMIPRMIPISRIDVNKLIVWLLFSALFLNTTTKFGWNEELNTAFWVHGESFNHNLINKSTNNDHFFDHTKWGIHFKVLYIVTWPLWSACYNNIEDFKRPLPGTFAAKSRAMDREQS